MLREFKEFVARGNAIDLAVAVIMGAAFGPIVTSLVNDVIMPPIGMVLGDIDFKEMFISLGAASFPTLTAAKEAGAPVIAYGLFVNAVINFLIVSVAIFLLVKQVNRMKKPAAAPAAPATKVCPFCLSAVPLKATRCAHCTSELQAA